MGKELKERNAEIMKLYAEGHTTNEIAALMNLTPGNVRNIRLRMHNREKVKGRICPNCKATGHLADAAYCYKCGTDIRTEAQQLEVALRKVIENIAHLPLHNDEIKILNRVAEYIARKDK